MGKSITAPSDRWVAVTPSDSVNIATGAPRALYIGTGGDVDAVDASGNSATFSNVLSGTILPIECVRVNDTSTTASNILALY